MFSRFARACAFVCFLISLRAIPARGADSAGEIRFNRDIRPIFSENCFACHGPDKNKRKAKLRLDDREVAIEKGAIVPGDPGKSELVRRIFTDDADDHMPPAESHKQLTLAQKELLKRWIAQGATYEPHWAYIKPVRPEAPHPKNSAWIRNPIDAFVLQTLEARGIQPSPQADPRTLLRRISFDLTGLPPGVIEVETFLQRQSDPKAYEKEVKSLLASPHYGERMAVPWLDLVRFADTVGYHGDQNQNVFPYRDYVIDSFNRNKHFDQFTIEQMAGDLLSSPTDEQKIATGFNRLNMVTREGGAQPAEYLAKYAADRVRTVATTWLGSTMACCECHDHKFDPFRTKDFYQMEAFFADIRQWGVYNDYKYTPNPDLRGFSNDHPFPPELEVTSPYLLQRLRKLRKQLTDLEAASVARLKQNKNEKSAFDQWRRDAEHFLKQHPAGWSIPVAAIPSKGTNTPPTNSVVRADQSILFSGKASESATVELRPDPGWIAALRCELIPTAENDGNVFRGKLRNTTLQLTAVLKSKGKDSKVGFSHADSATKEPRYVNGAEVIGVKDGWKLTGSSNVAPSAIYVFDRPLKLSEGDSIVLTLRSNVVGCVQFSVTPFANADALACGARPELIQALHSVSWLSPGRQDFLRREYLRDTGWDTTAFAQVKKLDGEIRECRDGRAPTLVTVAWKPAVTRVLPRGNWQDESGEIVRPLPPQFLSPDASAAGREWSRLDLARWVVSRDNPLTARTFVNRLWKQFFGTGICATVDDLGAQGDSPSHPELLDWLATEFMDSGWDVKRMVELIVTSSTYRQSSNLRPELKEIDPNNRLLASQNPRRLEAEFIRDNALAVSGLLNGDIGGPSDHPYQPAGYYANLQFPDRDYYADKDERQYRRGIYAHWQRTFLNPMLANFDAPSREECTANRTVSNTPQQALTLLNAPTFVEAARVLAAKVLATTPADSDRLALAVERTLDRPIKPAEEESLKKFLGVQREHYKADPDEAKQLLHVGLAPAVGNTDESELAAWTQVCRVILNLHEAITIY